MKIGITFSKAKNVKADDEYILAVKSVSSSLDVEVIQTDNIDLSDFCGIIFSGGKDIHPKYFSQDILVDNLSIDLDRDIFELNLYKKAKEFNIPILGICRGIQLINIAEGGSIYQDLTEQYTLALLYEHRFLSKDRQKELRRALRHSVYFKKDGILSKIYKRYNYFVNSRHHQAIDRLADNFEVLALADDGIIEAIKYRSDKQFILGVQWHPEQKEIYTQHKPLFRYFIDKAEEFCENRSI